MPMGNGGAMPLLRPTQTIFVILSEGTAFAVYIFTLTEVQRRMVGVAKPAKTQKDKDSGKSKCAQTMYKI